MVSRDEYLKIVADATPDHINTYYTPVMNAMAEFGIATDQQQVMFFSQVLAESGCFHTVVENLNYSAEGLLKTFPKYYRSISEANAHAKQPIKIASRVYANRMGNGNEASQDGWNFRGRGLIQITGKNNYVSFGNSIGQDLTTNPSYLETPEGAARSAGWYWKVNNLNRFVDVGDITGCSRAVNGGDNGLSDRISYYKRGMAIISAAPTKVDVVSFITLSLGSTGDAVKQLQTLLNINADGNFGLGTKAAVQDFQKRNGLVADGIVGPKTFELMKE